MTKKEEFQPAWTSAPGDTIADILAERNLSILEFAKRMRQTSEHANDLLQGRATITIGVARQLTRVLGSSVEFWMSRDFQYREHLNRDHITEEQWIKELPLGDMIKFGWITPTPRPSDEVPACLRFFNVPNVRAWHEAYAGVQEMVAFRTSPSFDSQPAAVAAWLRQGEIESDRIQCKTWHASRFGEALPRVRSMTREKDPHLFIPELQRLCADCGVAVAVVRAPTGCRASGATRFLSPSKAFLLFSFRYLTDDHFWFTFFHEAGHLLLHGKKRFFLEGVDGSSTGEEQEANEFAARTLIPPEFRQELLNLPINTRDVVRFARRLDVSPGIVVGQLQHMERIGKNRMNRLKRRFAWED